MGLNWFVITFDVLFIIDFQKDDFWLLSLLLLCFVRWLNEAENGRVVGYGSSRFRVVIRLVLWRM